MAPKKMKNVIICGSMAYMEDRVRLTKLKEVFSHHNIPFQFWGWNRLKTTKQTSYKTKHLYFGGGFSNKSLLLHYPLWITMVFLHSLKLKKNDIVYALSLDVAVPIYISSLIKGFSYVFDNPDNFSLTYNLKGIFKQVIDKIESVVAKHALFHILPVESRYVQKDKNILIAPNFPLQEEIEKAKSLFKHKKIDTFDLNTILNDYRFKIYINGRMVFHRGSEWLAEIFKELDPEKFLIISAGDIYCDKLKNTLQTIKNAVLFPQLENAKALGLYFCSDVVLAFYDPVLPINRKAAPNKWWDCVACKVPFISNSEIETLSVFKEKKACFDIPYKDTSALINLLNTLQANPDKLESVKSNLSLLNVLSWDLAMKPLITKLTDEF